MKPIYLSFIFLTSSYLVMMLIQFLKNKGVWTDASVYLNHQFILMSGFVELQIIFAFTESSDYKNFSNLKNNNVSIGYKAILDNPACGTAETNTPWIFKSEQASSDSDLVMEMFNQKKLLILDPN